MRTNKEWMQLYIDEVGSKYAKNIKLRPKSESKLIKLIAPIIMIFNKNFMENYIITIGNTIWHPDNFFDRGDMKSRLETIAHECIHVKQSVKQTNLVHAFLYLFPQSLIVFSLLSFLAIPFGLGWLACLLFLLCLAPIPAPFRYLKELEAFRVSILFSRHVYNSNKEMLEWIKERIVTNLSKSDYYFTWPFPNMILKDLGDESKLNEKQYKEILEFLKRHELTTSSVH